MVGDVLPEINAFPRNCIQRLFNSCVMMYREIVADEDGILDDPDGWVEEKTDSSSGMMGTMWQMDRLIHCCQKTTCYL
jgi:hypothetical protein